MKTLVLLIFAIVGIACSYCEIGTRQSMYWNGGHQEAVYQFSSGKSFILVCSGNAYKSCPYNIRYDFWKGEFCR